jgi:hypothetical protein
VSRGEGNGDRAAGRLGAAGPENGLSGAGHTRRRHGTNNERHKNSDERQQSEETEKTKKTELKTTFADNAIARRTMETTAVKWQSADFRRRTAAVITTAMAVRAVQGGTRGLAEAGRKGL